MYQSNMDGATRPVATPPETTPPSAVTPSATAATTSASPPSPPATGKPKGFALPTAKLMPVDYTHVGQALVLKGYYGDQLCYSEATDWLVYNGSYYEQGMETRARGLAQKMTNTQLHEAEAALKQCKVMSKQSGLSDKQKNDLAYTTKMMEAYRSHVSRCRSSSGITGTLRELRPMLLTTVDDLDADPFLLNTPTGTVDLQTGKMLPHKSTDLITKQTNYSPSLDGMDLWLDALDTFFRQDQELIDYVQEIVGISAIGRVYNEFLIIAYGSGRNGKSTFWNTVSQVLGTYSGNLSAETLMVTKANVQPEMAELQGKRLVIASELEEGMRLNTARVKQICSTDRIFAAKKYLQPTSFAPSHTVVLCTNHLPKVGAIDTGTWRRLLVIPFNAKIETDSDVKNYSAFLCETAGEAILQWIIDGAVRVIAKDYHLREPAVVQDAVKKYRDDQNWLAHFLEECCEVDASYTAPSGKTYTRYRDFCREIGEYSRSTTDFYAALESQGYYRSRTRDGKIVHGFRLLPDPDDDSIIVTAPDTPVPAAGSEPAATA